MIILGIETSCDETAVSLIEATGGLEVPHFRVLGSALYSQVALHTQYGGVYPNLAKREHAKNLVPLLEKVLGDAMYTKPGNSFSKDIEKEITEILIREENLGNDLISFLEKFEKPAIDLIAVTQGPGLEPALWVGVQFAKALSLAWNIPVVPTNHMKGHIASVLISSDTASQGRSLTPKFPALALLISGGHTEIVLCKDWVNCEIIGQTRDDAVGEAYDKVARMLGLSYPGGPEISKLADMARKSTEVRPWETSPRLDLGIPAIHLPRPMIKSGDLDFSFSGLKTAVLYKIRDLEVSKMTFDTEVKCEIAREFEDAVVDVLVAKVSAALIETGASTLIIAGGVIANTTIRETFQKLIQDKFSYVQLYIPEKNLATDNAVMIACAGYLEYSHTQHTSADFKAVGNLSY